MGMEVQGGDGIEQPRSVKVAKRVEWGDFLGSVDDRRSKSPRVVDGNVERLHQRAGVGGEALLAWHQGVAVMEVFDLPLLHVVGEPDIVMRSQQQAGAFSLEPFLDG